MPSNTAPVLLPSSQRDSHFSGDGVAHISLDGELLFVNGLSIQEDGQYLIVGSYWTSGPQYFFIARTNTDGTLDSNFSTDGFQTTGLLGHDFANDVSIQSNGNIVLAGGASSGFINNIALARYSSQGELDSTFSGDGLQVTPLNNQNSFATNLAIQSDGRIIVAGTKGTDIAVLRYLSNGNVDTSFANQGTYTGSFGTSSASTYAMCLDHEGRPLIAGYAWSGSSWDIGVARLTSTGVLDTGFSGDGKLLINLASHSGSIDVAKAIAIQADGKILVAGQTHPITHNS